MVKRKPTAQPGQSGPLNNIVSKAKKVSNMGSSVIGASKSIRSTQGK